MLTALHIPRPRLFYGWYVVAAAALINLYGAGVWFYGFSIFYPLLLDEFGWSAAAGAAVVSLSRLEGGLEGPFVGWLVDRFGPRRMAVFGGVVTGLGFMMMSRLNGFDIGPVHVSSFVAFVLLYAGWMSVGFNSGFSQASQAAVNAWFIRLRSRAFALFSLGAGGSGITIFVLGWLADTHGWRTAAFFSGVGIFVFVIPVSLLLRQRPEQYGQLPDGDDPAEAVLAGTGAGRPVVELRRARGEGETDFTVRQVIRTPSFWMLVISWAARSVAMTSIVLHQVNYLTDVRGISLGAASAALGAMVTISLIGRMTFGFLGDFIDKRYLMMVSYLLQAVGVFLLASVTSMGQVWVFAAVYGVGYGGGIPVSMAIIGEYFGRRNFATIRGFMQLFLMPATVAGPIYAGWIYDTTDSYQFAFNSFIVVLVLGAGVMFFARRPRQVRDSVPAPLSSR